MARPTLMEHRKFKRLVALLRLPRPHVRGLLELLWDSAYESGDDLIGDSVDVELAAGWEGECGALTAALVACGRPGKGFIEKRGRSYHIHDLDDHAPRYVSLRARREHERRLKGKSIRDLRADAGRLGGAASAQQTRSKRAANGQQMDSTCAANGSTRARARARAHEVSLSHETSLQEPEEKAHDTAHGHEPDPGTETPEVIDRLAEAFGPDSEQPPPPADRELVALAGKPDATLDGIAELLAAKYSSRAQGYGVRAPNHCNAIASKLGAVWDEPPARKAWVWLFLQAVRRLTDAAARQPVWETLLAANRAGNVERNPLLNPAELRRAADALRRANRARRAQDRLKKLGIQDGDAVIVRLKDGAETTAVVSGEWLRFADGNAALSEWAPAILRKAPESAETKE